MWRWEILDKTEKSALEHVKRIGVIIGVCVPYSSLEWYKKSSRSWSYWNVKIWNEKRKVHQNNYSGIGVVVYGVENESGKIGGDSLESFKDNNLGLRCVSFKLSAREAIMNAIRIEFQGIKQLWFEVLKGVNAEDKVECEGEKWTTKQVLHAVEVNQRRIFVGIEQGVRKQKRLASYNV